MMRYQIILWYLFYCIKIWVAPWKFFQLNANYFNRKKGIFSKQEINQLIPFQWRLSQYISDKKTPPKTFPSFIKPEWGQNSYGIFLADDDKKFRDIGNHIVNSQLTYLIQEAAKEVREFEIFYIRDANRLWNYKIMTITEVLNNSGERHPVNSVHNINTSYVDLSKNFNDAQLDSIWRLLSRIGNFKIARVAIKSNSISNLLKGKFHIVEINLFAPMPINLLDPNISWKSKISFIKKSMHSLAKCTKAISKQQKTKNIFFRKLIMHYKVKHAISQSMDLW